MIFLGQISKKTVTLVTKWLLWLPNFLRVRIFHDGSAITAVTFFVEKFINKSNRVLLVIACGVMNGNVLKY